jgi:hypothetical protein
LTIKQQLGRSAIVHVKLYLTDDTQLRAHGFAVDHMLVAEVHWDVPVPGSRPSTGTLWGTPSMLRQLAELAVQAAIQAEEEACWQAHQAATAGLGKGRVA